MAHPIKQYRLFYNSNITGKLNSSCTCWWKSQDAPGVMRQHS